MSRIVLFIANSIAGIVFAAIAATMVSAEEIPCIDGALTYHVHPQLIVLEFVPNASDPRGVDAKTILPPHNLGLSPKNGGADSCDREIHTHGAEQGGGHPGLLHTTTQKLPALLHERILDLIEAPLANG
jgi:hypothetical protein